MRNPLLAIMKNGIITQRELCPVLSDDATGLPAVTAAPPCTGCGRCVPACPTRAITIAADVVTLDRGRCLGCNACVACCPSGTLQADRATRTAALTRDALLCSNRPQTLPTASPVPMPFRRSLHVREVSTGSNATDQEVSASTNAIFDVARYGIHFVASPRYADALLVTGPVGKAMQEPLRRCYDAMAEPRLVIAVGTDAISGGLHRDGYATANGVDAILPVACYVPGDPPHPWSIIHGLLLAMGHRLV